MFGSTFVFKFSHLFQFKEENYQFFLYSPNNFYLHTHEKKLPWPYTSPDSTDNLLSDRLWMPLLQTYCNMPPTTTKG